MKYRNMFDKVMKEQEEIALATSMKDQPNVRIVNFLYSEKRKAVFFTTFKGNQKIEEFQANEAVAFTTIPSGTTEHVNVKTAKVKLSELSVADMKEAFVAKLPDMEGMIAFAGDQLCLYEITFDQAKVVIDHTQIETIRL